MIQCNGQCAKFWLPIGLWKTSGPELVFPTCHSRFRNHSIYLIFPSFWSFPKMVPRKFGIVRHFFKNPELLLLYKVVWFQIFKTWFPIFRNVIPKMVPDPDFSRCGMRIGNGYTRYTIMVPDPDFSVRERD